MEKIKITPKQHEILILLYRYRFLNRKQIQKFLNHKYPRRINSWLKDMTDKKIISRKYSYKLKENTKPAIYHLSSGSKKILLKDDQVNKNLIDRVYQEKNRSKKFINRCLLTADIFFHLKDQSLVFNNKLHYYTKTDLSVYDYFPYRLPDAYIVLETNNNLARRYFLEIIANKTPCFVLRNRIQIYVDYFEAGGWYKKTGYPLPKILIICPNKYIKSYFKKYISQLLEEGYHQVQYFLALASDIKTKGIRSDTWEEA